MILFRTPGVIELAGLTTFGLSSKDESQIGRFGTGMKYASAIVVRLGGSLRIRTAQGEKRLGVSPAMFRGKPVAYVTLDDERLAFTTELGRDWLPWMAFREFYANTLDEGGTFYRAQSESQLPAPCPAHTDIIIDCAEFDAVHDNFEEFFIDPEDTPIYASSGLEIYAGQSKQVFYRGFAVYDLPTPAKFRYNILGSLDLTEDRTAASAWEVFGKLENAFSHCTDEAVLETVLHADSEFESCLSYSTHTDVSAAFLGVAKKLGDSASAPAALAAAHTEHRRAKNSGQIYEDVEQGAGSQNLMNAIAHLRIMGAPLEGLKAAYHTIPGERELEVNKYSKTFIINKKFRDDESRTLSLVLQAYLEIYPDFAYKRLLKLARELGKSLKVE